MFVIQLNYKKSLHDVEKHIEGHREFLKRNYSEGKFLLSGRKEPRTGGIILAVSDTRAEIENIIRVDPFYTNEIAEYVITEFIPSMAEPHYLGLITK